LGGKVKPDAPGMQERPNFVGVMAPDQRVLRKRRRVWPMLRHEQTRINSSIPQIPITTPGVLQATANPQGAMIPPAPQVRQILQSADRGCSAWITVPRRRRYFEDWPAYVWRRSRQEANHARDLSQRSTRPRPGLLDHSLGQRDHRLGCESGG